eukprot:TRINITY_DN3597_c0_g1_i6.p1 TRINITY_DN3597_c0_g1~~TRINITY_DN3597_c0_g1_i6.p1  ORF type:complete len:278 (-),score=31.65 TRINITY_DN3597_c0_g1_i6:427-1173(-)
MQLFFHPVYPNVWVALAQSASFFHGNPNVVPWNMQLMLTRDSANTWTKQDTYVQAFSFVPPDHAKKEVLCIWTSHDTKSGPQNQYAFDDVTFHMSDDLFATIVPLTKGVTGFTYWGHILMVSMLSKKSANEQDLLVRSGKDFHVAKVPSDVPNHAFTLLTPDHDHSHGPAFLYVDHSRDHNQKSELLPWGNIYMSAGTRYDRFSVSLKNVVGGVCQTTTSRCVSHTLSYTFSHSPYPAAGSFPCCAWS